MLAPAGFNTWSRVCPCRATSQTCRTDGNSPGGASKEANRLWTSSINATRYLSPSPDQAAWVVCITAGQACLTPLRGGPTPPRHASQGSVAEGLAGSIFPPWEGGKYHALGIVVLLLGPGIGMVLSLRRSWRTGSTPSMKNQPLLHISPSVDESSLPIHRDAAGAQQHAAGLCLRSLRRGRGLGCFAMKSQRAAARVLQTRHLNASKTLGRISACVRRLQCRICLSG